jgi:hypothetical protein
MEVGQKPFTQKKPQQLVYLELGSGNGGMLLSISEDGFRFRAVSPVRPDGPMPFAFSLDGVNRLEGTGEIESLEDDGKSGGLRFGEISDDFRAKLDNWLSADSSVNSTGREVTPAAATPLDTMEKIREEIRAGSSSSPRQPRPATPEPTSAATPVPSKRQVAEKKAEPSAPARKIPQPIVTEQLVTEAPVAQTPVTEQPFAGKSIEEWPSFERPVIERIIPEPSPIPPFSERLPEPKEPPNTASRLFPLPSPAVPETEKPAALASAFVKLARETKSPAATTMAPAAPPVSSSPAASKFPASVPPTTRMASSTLFIPVAPPALVVNVPPDEGAEKEQPRRYVHALDVSLDVAWENAKLSSPAEPPHLSRAAAGGIITIALAVILGALAFNFRQEIGAIFIQLGQRISGDNRADTPPQDVTPENQPGDAQNQTQTSPQPESQQRSAPANLSSASKSSTSSPKTNGAGANGESTNAKTEVPTGTKSGVTPAVSAPNAGSSEIPPTTKTAENPAAQNPPNAAAKTETPVSSGTGQEEFDAAREILRGKNRAEELSRAVELLWSAVKKGNVPAEVTLGDLYRRGDGVEKSCDQARVLLVAASKKGSSDARQQLEQMAERGCE